jgi:predicted transcriptional regulator
MDLHNEALRTFFLGPLEKQSLRAIWSRGSATLPELMESGDFHCHINTLRTTLERLCRKQFLTRVPEKGVFRYSPTCDESQFQRRGITEMVRALLSGEDEPAQCLTYLVDAITTHNGRSSEELIAAIQRKRREIVSA